MQLSLLGKSIDLCFPRYCTICGNRLVGTEDALCTACLLGLPYTNTWQDPYENDMAKMFWLLIPIERCCALFYYHSHAPSSNAIYALKYGNRPDTGIYLGRLIAQRGIDCHFFDDIDAIIPIPLAPKRQKHRGYNQSEMIAKGIRQMTHLPIIADAVKRDAFVESQTHKNRWQRQENVKNVFRLSDFYHDHQGCKHPIKDLAGKHLLIIDDVCTTGATIIACCHELMKVGHIKFSVVSIGWTKE